jgi:outer membrane immunogenic protein
MKFLMTAASLAAIGAALPVFAHAQQVQAPTGLYGNLGYSDADGSGVNLGAIQGRLGYRLNNWFGVEGELATGVKNDKFNVAPGVDAKVKLKLQEAIYGVGFLPLTPQWDLIGRVGYGGDTIRTSAVGLRNTDADNSWNFGAGAQYHFDGKNGIRADYTREEFVGHGADHANVWSVAYSRRF